MDLVQYQNKLRLCRRCKDVVGPPLVLGNQKAKIVHISQAPSQSAIKNQRSFSDKSGERLKYRWYQISDKQFYNPDNFYITSIAHCFPGKDKKGADKKAPLICALTWLKKEISYLKPKLFIIVGKQAAEFLFPKKDYCNLIARNQKLNGINCVVLPHPSPVNVKWFKDHLEFEKERLPQIRILIHQALI